MALSGVHPQLVEQPRVLDGDDGLRGEIGQLRQVCLGEGLWIAAQDH
jgi:hypothetical protein